MWLKDTGILNKLKDDVINRPMPIPLPKLRHNQPLILRQLGITVIILAIGLFISLLVFLGEFWIGKKKRFILNPKDHYEMSRQTSDDKK